MNTAIFFNSIFSYSVRPLGNRSTPSQTPAQAYAARWDLAPNPYPRPMPIIPRGATVEPTPSPFSWMTGAVHSPTNLVSKASSVKDRRSSSRVGPLILANRSITFDESHLVNTSQDTTPKPSNTSINHPTHQHQISNYPTFPAATAPSNTLPPLQSQNPSPATFSSLDKILHLVTPESQAISSKASPRPSAPSPIS